MKKILCLLLAACFILACFSACAKDKPDDEPVTDNVTEEAPKPVMPDIEYTDVLDLMNGDLLGKAESECELPEESLFLTGDNVVGYDYVCIGDAIGNMTLYLTGGVVSSYVFGSAPYDNTDEFQYTGGNLCRRLQKVFELRNKAFHFYTVLILYSGSSRTTPTLYRPP